MSNTLSSPAIRWEGNALSLLDQRKLPLTTEWVAVVSADQCASAIHDMVVRGAPAIGIAAAYGIVLAARDLGSRASAATLQPALETLAASRPTAVNLFWALQRMRSVMADAVGDALQARLEQEARQIHLDDQSLNHRLAAYGAALLPDQATVYTHCNTGALATGGHGTALGIIRTAWEQGRLSAVYAGETRPWMQGSRLTAWELQEAGIPCTLVVDSCAGHLMASGRIQAVIVGADRITANGDTANKIGTYSLAVLARHHGIPFIVAAPLSTIDPALAEGGQIIIEERNPEEVCSVGGHRLAPDAVSAFNPAFDVTPAALISAIVTEQGVVQQPDVDKMSALLEKARS